jgi:acetyl esterase/lipase
VLFAAKAKAAGVDVKLHVYPGLFHSFQLFTLVPEAGKAIAECGEFGRAHLGSRLSPAPNR